MNNATSNNPTSHAKLSLFTAVLTGGLASACCVGPFIFAVLGLGSASFFIVLEPFRPLFAAITIGLLLWAGWQYWRKRKVCLAQGCKAPNPVWVIGLGLLSVVLLFFPYIY